jgi:hypothetical protein
MNDLMTTEDGKWMVFTRGRGGPKNGIVIASTADPACTEGGRGVHSMESPPACTRRSCTRSPGTARTCTSQHGTGSLNIIDINDPMHPKRVAGMEDEGDAGRAGAT